MAVRKRGNVFQVIYRCAGETSPRTETFRSEDEAIIRDMQIKLSKKNGTFTAPIRTENRKIPQKKDITLSEYLGEFIEGYGLKKWGNSYYTNSLGLMKNYIIPYFGNRYLRSITVRDLDEYYTRMLNEPAVVGKHRDTGAKISADTVGRIHKLLKSAFGKAVLWQYMDINPTLGATLPTHRPQERAVWSDEEALKALEACNIYPLRIYAFIWHWGVVCDLERF